MRPTTATAQELKQNVRRSMELLKTLRDQVRVELHLAGMEAKDEWEKLEKRLPNLEALSDNAGHVLDETITNVRAFRDALLAKKPKS